MVRTTQTLLAILIAASSLAACAAGTDQDDEIEVAGQSDALHDGDNDGHDDYDDRWRGTYGQDKHNRNSCPLVQAIAQPPSIDISQTTRLKGFAYDNDGPRSLKVSWSVEPAAIGSLVNKNSKRTTFKCLEEGRAVITFTATDGDCSRSAKTTVECHVPAGTTTSQLQSAQPAAGAEAFAAPVEYALPEATSSLIIFSLCGNGRKDLTERCDNSSPRLADHCPTSCSDGQACTKDTLIGSAANCTAQCTFTKITSCTSSDGCCPTSCTNPTDLDCAPRCGDGVKNGSELCDGTGADRCPTSCDDRNACTKDVLTGSGARCNAVCSHTWIAGCVGPTACGDGFKNGNETCDNSDPNPANKCPTSCDDGVGCTTDTLTGSAASCNLTCSHVAINVCKNDDGCCPSNTALGCSDLNDNNCTTHPVKCGDGHVDPPETCDGNCVTTCDDKDPCTTDVLSGKASTCNVLCTHTAVTSCNLLAQDSCCATGCNANTDLDCISVCGNSVVESSGGETCDPASTCPTSCDDHNACTKDTLVGDPTKCKSACTNTAITACVNGDGCCAPGCKNTCNGGTDNDCPCIAKCGNGVLDAGETCDNSTTTKCPTTCNDNDACTVDVMSGAASTCDVTCTHNAITVCTGATGDQCCPANCNSITDGDCIPKCGNGVLETNELCDSNCPKADADCDDGDPCTLDKFVAGVVMCANTCSHSPLATPACLCGNGAVDPGETCDGDASCQAIIDACSDNNDCTTDSITGSAGTCDVACTHAGISTPTCTCGNGTLDVGETCDNTSSTTCPTSCSAGSDACNPIVLTGDPMSCSAACTPAPVTNCANGDGCCPPQCTRWGFDNDCVQNTPCSQCEMSCNDGPNNRCDGLAGQNTSAGSPMPGMDKAVLCRKILDCFHASHCGANFNDSDCYCGTDQNGDSQDSSACFSGAVQANGPCKALVEAGAESTDVNDVSLRYFDEQYSVGAATTVLESCDYLNCNNCL